MSWRLEATVRRLGVIKYGYTNHLTDKHDCSFVESQWAAFDSDQEVQSHSGIEGVLQRQLLTG